MIKNIILLAFIFVLVDAGFLYLMRNNFQTMIKKIQGSSLNTPIFTAGHIHGYTQPPCALQLAMDQSP